MGSGEITPKVPYHTLIDEMTHRLWLDGCGFAAIAEYAIKNDCSYSEAVERLYDERIKRIGGDNV